MGHVRVVGRAGGGRCVVCHDAADTGMVRCAGCLTQWHPDCTPTSGRCPTIGCTAAVADADSSRARSVPRLAQVGPYRRRLARGLAALFLMTAVAAALAAAVLHPASPLRVVPFTWGDGPPPLPLVLAFGTLIVVIIGSLLVLPVSLLVTLSRQLREVRHLLDHAAPVPMRLSTSWAPSGPDWPPELRIELEGRAGPLAGQRFDVTVRAGGLPAWLATRQVDCPVLVRGLPPPGPFLIEAVSGALALVEP